MHFFGQLLNRNSIEAKTPTGKTMFVSLMIIVFACAALISATVNLFLFAQMSTIWYEIMIFCGMSITLEGTKVYTVIKANTLMAISKKLNDDRIKATAIRFYCMYGAFALLAIIAALGLSLTITSRDSIATNSTSTIIATTIADDNRRIAEIDAELPTLKTEAKTLADAYEKYQTLSQDRYDINAKIKVLAAKTRTTDEQALYVSLKSDYAKKGLERDAILILYGNDVNKLVAQINANTAKQQALANERTAKNDDITAQKNAGETTKAESSKKAGTSNMFVVIAGVFSWSAEIFRLIMLMFVTSLVELTVFSCSPEVKITPALLRQFRKHLPNDVDLEALVVMFIEEERLFNSLDKRYADAKDIVDIAPVSVEAPAPAPTKTRKTRGPNKPKVVAQVVAAESAMETPAQAIEPEQERFMISLPAEPEETVIEATAVDVPTLDVDSGSFDAVEAMLHNPEADKYAREAIDKRAIELAYKALEQNPAVTLPSDSLVQAEVPADVLASFAEPKEEPVAAEEAHGVTPITLPRTKRDIPMRQVPLAKVEAIDDTPVASVPVRRVSNAKGTVTYRFGKASPEIKERFVQFLDAMYANVDNGKDFPQALVNPVDCAKALDLVERSRDVILDRLLDLDYNGKRLIIRDKGNYYTNFEADFVKKYTTEEL